MRDRGAQGGLVSRPVQPERELQSQPRTASRLLVTYPQTLSQQLPALPKGLKYHHGRLKEHRGALRQDCETCSRGTASKTLTVSQSSESTRLGTLG